MQKILTTIDSIDILIFIADSTLDTIYFVSRGKKKERVCDK